MNSTNRALNRLFIAVVGLLLLAAGALAVLLAAVPAVRSAWSTAARDLASGAPAWVAQPAVGRATLLVLGVVVVAVLLILLLVAFVARQGRGRTAAALEHGDADGPIRIDLAVPRTLLEQHLAQQPAIAGVRISAYEVRGAPMLKVTVRCRRGAAPDRVAALVGRSIADLEQVLGADVPAFVQLTGGHRLGRTAEPRVA